MKCAIAGSHWRYKLQVPQPLTTLTTQTNNDFLVNNNLTSPGTKIKQENKHGVKKFYNFCELQ